MNHQLNEKNDCRKTIYYDGSCSMCASIIKKIDRSSQKEKFNPKDITKDPLPQQISKNAAEKEIHVMDENGRVYKNAEAILKILEEYPKWKFLVWIGRLAIIKQILPIGYKFVATHRHSLFNPSEKKGPNAFIVFMFIYILIVFPLALFTEESIFPFSRFPMYAQNTLYTCGYQIRLYRNDQAVNFGRDRVANLFLKYSRESIAHNSSSVGDMCQFIRQVFWPANVSHDSFYVKRYCTDINKLPSLEFDEQIALICH